jgi:hypothetical protein
MNCVEQREKERLGSLSLGVLSLSVMEFTVSRRKKLPLSQTLFKISCRIFFFSDAFQ